MKKIIVAIDGHSGCGKSSTAKTVARDLNFTYIDSGAMYRAATLFLNQKGVNFNEADKISEFAKEIEIDFQLDDTNNFITILNGKSVESDIRSLEVSNLVSKYSTVPTLREAMVKLQRKLSEDRNVIMDGRDIGSVVFPDADLKIFMTADLGVRAKRRLTELQAEGKYPSLDEVMTNLSSRDEMDSNRKESPLVQAPDAVVVDTTNLSFEEQVQLVTKMVSEKMSS